MTKSQKRAYSKLGVDWRSAAEIAENERTLLALVSKSYIESKIDTNTRYYRRR